MNIDIEKKTITITQNVTTLVLTEDEYAAIKYALSKGADTYTSRREIRNVPAPTTLMRRLLAEMQLRDEPSKVSDAEEANDEDEEDYDEEDEASDED